MNIAISSSWAFSFISEDPTNYASPAIAGFCGSWLVFETGTRQSPTTFSSGYSGIPSPLCCDSGVHVWESIKQLNAHLEQHHRRDTVEYWLIWIYIIPCLFLLSACLFSFAMCCSCIRDPRYQAISASLHPQPCQLPAPLLRFCHSTSTYSRINQYWHCLHSTDRGLAQLLYCWAIRIWFWLVKSSVVQHCHSSGIYWLSHSSYTDRPLQVNKCPDQPTTELVFFPWDLFLKTQLI